MSEALVTLPTLGIERLPVPAGSTPKQVKLAALSLYFDPERDTFTSMMLEAGYSPVTALASARRALESAGTRRAAAALEAALESDRDNATQLQRQSVQQMLKRIGDDSASDVLLLGAVTKAIELKSVLPDTSSEASLPPSWYRGQRRRALLRADANGYRRGYAAGLAAAGKHQE